jgi:membrane-associated phospholipid phosphatase
VVYSFPSGHVLEALVIFGVIAIEIARRGVPLAVAVLLLALVAADVTLVGVARVALAAHYPSDALGGGLAGVGVLGVYGWLRRPTASSKAPSQRRAT